MEVEGLSRAATGDTFETEETPELSNGKVTDVLNDLLLLNTSTRCTPGRGYPAERLTGLLSRCMSRRGGVDMSACVFVLHAIAFCIKSFGWDTYVY